MIVRYHWNITKTIESNHSMHCILFNQIKLTAFCCLCKYKALTRGKKADKTLHFNYIGIRFKFLSLFIFSELHYRQRALKELKEEDFIQSKLTLFRAILLREEERLTICRRSVKKLIFICFENE